MNWINGIDIKTDNGRARIQMTATKSPYNVDMNEFLNQKIEFSYSFSVDDVDSFIVNTYDIFHVVDIRNLFTWISTYIYPKSPIDTNDCISFISEDAKYSVVLYSVVFKPITKGHALSYIDMAVKIASSDGFAVQHINLDQTTIYRFALYLMQFMMTGCGFVDMNNLYHCLDDLIVAKKPKDQH